MRKKHFVAAFLSLVAIFAAILTFYGITRECSNDLQVVDLSGNPVEYCSTIPNIIDEWPPGTHITLGNERFKLDAREHEQHVVVFVLLEAVCHAAQFTYSLVCRGLGGQDSSGCAFRNWKHIFNSCRNR